MMDHRLPDGTWVTTAICVAPYGKMTVQCAECEWVDDGPPGGENEVKIQVQRCARCGWVRGKYLGNPHPEVTDGGRDAAAPV
jgi:hypothetical protein